LKCIYSQQFHALLSAAHPILHRALV
jgi:hypothetical protein